MARMVSTGSCSSRMFKSISSPSSVIRSQPLILSSGCQSAQPKTPDATLVTMKAPPQDSKTIVALKPLVAIFSKSAYSFLEIAQDRLS